MVQRPPHLRPVESPALERENVAAVDHALPREVLLRARQGDVSAWAQIYVVHAMGVFRQIRYLTGDPNVAEELAQETFAQAMSHHARFDPARPVVGWLHGIALNVVRKHWRKQRNTARAHERLEIVARIGTVGAGGAGDPDSHHLRRERSRALHAVLDDLPPRWREAFVLRELQGLSTAEAAAMLGITAENLAVRVNRARTRIREELGRRGWLSGYDEVAR
jgi:RNA polymerase sigma-70 factor (ECF subfamily)